MKDIKWWHIGLGLLVTFGIFVAATYDIIYVYVILGGLFVLYIRDKEKSNDTLQT